MTEHITGAQARELLDGTTPGPWEWRHNDYPEHDEDHDALGNGEKTALRSQDAEQYSSWVSGSEQDRALAAAAPTLAETVAWLYGKSITPDESEGDYYSTFRGGYTYADQGHVHLNVALSDAFTPDEAVDLARALLAAAEKARCHTD